jgi:hypothetical protein
MMKTVLAPNAPWPKWEQVPPKRSHHKKKRSKPEETDLKFEQWLKEQNYVKSIRRR